MQARSDQLPGARSVPEQPLQLHLSELAVHELLHLAAVASSLPQLKASATPKQAQLSAAGRPHQPPPAVLQGEAGVVAGPQSPAGALAACIAVHNQSTLDLVVGQAGTLEQLSLAQGTVLQCRCGSLQPMHVPCSASASCELLNTCNISRAHEVNLAPGTPPCMAGVPRLHRSSSACISQRHAYRLRTQTLTLGLRWLSAPGLAPAAKLELAIRSQGGPTGLSVPVYTRGDHSRDLALPNGLCCTLAIASSKVGKGWRLRA